MNNAEARALLRAELRKYVRRSYGDLVTLIDHQPLVVIAVGESGARYQMVVQTWWDAKPGGDVRVVTAIDDGGWRWCVPLTDAFLRGPDEPIWTDAMADQF